MTHDTASRLQALWDHLGLEVVHVATKMAADIVKVAQTTPQRIAGLVLSVPARLDRAPFAALAQRTTLIAGELSLTATVTTAAQARLPGA